MFGRFCEGKLGRVPPGELPGRAPAPGGIVTEGLPPAPPKEGRFPPIEGPPGAGRVAGMEGLADAFPIDGLLDVAGLEVAGLEVFGRAPIEGEEGR